MKITSKKVRAAEIDIKPVYYFKDNLRFVEPYYYIHSTFAKQRWLGQSLLAVLTSEFNHFRAEKYYKYAIESGRVKLNGEIASCERRMENSDLLETNVHKHEPPIADEKIEIIYNSDDLLVVSKPASFPVHPTGKYRHNTLLHILKHEMADEIGLKSNNTLHFVNRLDRLTSGLVLIAKTKEKASLMGKAMMDRSMQKTYLARVKGKFPDGVTECDAKLQQISHKIGIHCVSESGRESSTKFTFLSYNGITSLVKCEPRTGRTHQIRVHLQYLGFPIANDPIYCSDAWGKDYAKGGLDVEERKSLINTISSKDFPKDAEYSQDFVGCIECIEKRVDPIPEQIVLWLHSLQYKGENWEFKTKLPEWAIDGWNGDCDIEKRFWNFGGKWDGLTVGDWA